MKAILRSSLAQALIPRLLGQYLSLILRTNSWTFDGAEHFAPLATGGSGVVGFWHEDLPLMPALTILARQTPGYRPVPVLTLVSQHRDGRFIGAIVRRFGIEPVLGSTSRGGGAGLRALLRILRRGAIIGITPDGPRGPRRHAAPGLAQLAGLAGVPVVPCAARTSRRIVLNSWDRMAIPLPFGRGIVVCGPKIMVARDNWRASLPAIEAAMNQAASRADQLAARG